MNKKLALLPFLTLVTLLLLAFPRPAAAQDQDSDPPSRVARLDYIQGAVSFQPSGEQDWLEADVNRPLTTGDNLWSDQDSRGEVHIGATAIRLSSNTGISFLNLDDRTAQLQLAQGTIEVHLRNLEPGNAFEIDTPNLAFTLATSGEYVVQTNPDGNSTLIIVREGQGQVTAAGETYDLAAGQQYIFNGTDAVSYDAQAAPDFDDFENWCQAQDQRENASPSARYVSRDVDGYSDLDDSGEWQADADYGEVWYPSGVVTGWAPYRYGHWIWIGPWGWTWVESEPWGFAPFHYGRWISVRGAWGWVPGPLVVRPVYAPALVGFVGGGGGFSLAVGFGGGFSGVAWFPLGPRDVYIPGYRSSARYVQNINVTNTRVINVTQVNGAYNGYLANRNEAVNRMNYTYAHNAAAVTAVSRDVFVGGRPVATATVRVTPDQLQNARVVEASPLAPTSASYVSANARVVRTKPPVPFSQKPVVARLSPPTMTSRSQRLVSAETAPNGAQPAARGNAFTNTETPARGNEQPAPARPAAPTLYTNDNLPHAPRPDSDAAPNTESNERNNGNSASSANGRPGNNGAAQPRPAVKFTPPTKARDDMYDVHPPLNQRPTTPRPAPQPQHEQASHQQAPAHSAPAPSPAPRPKS
ncbi:MAG: DUF6600 domain-containing protein [Candidatus Acidiferrales bacterium]